jgi:hypothetical protein
VTRLYDRSFALRARDPDVRLLQLLIICHGALLSGAATIGRGVPGDTIAITRRAVEATRLAAAIKSDPVNYERWCGLLDRCAPCLSAPTFLSMRLAGDCQQPPDVSSGFAGYFPEPISLHELSRVLSQPFRSAGVERPRHESRWP